MCADVGIRGGRGKRGRGGVSRRGIWSRNRRRMRRRERKNLRLRVRGRGGSGVGCSGWLGDACCSGWGEGRGILWVDLLMLMLGLRLRLRRGMIGDGWEGVYGGDVKRKMGERRGMDFWSE